MHRRTRAPRFSWQGPVPRTVAGLLSGTSADGISAVLVEIRDLKDQTKVRELAFVHRPYPRELRDEILSNSVPGRGSVDTICRLNVTIATRFAEALVGLSKKARLPRHRIDLIGSHGQTVQHRPPPKGLADRGLGSTLQIGDPSVIANITGIPTVGDFRTADMALGGEGAPLVPFLDYLVFRSRTESRLLLNLGGIANVTMLPRGCTAEDVVGFDTGPANILIDALAVRLLGATLDHNGTTARSGTVQSDLLSWLMRNPYFFLPPPKSTGREEFGVQMVETVIASFPAVTAADLFATFTEFTALSVYDQYVRFVRRRTPADVVFVSGGGLHNRHMMRRLREMFHPIAVVPTPNVGFTPDAKEAVLFAVLARRTVLGLPSNLPRVTGASRPVILGKICVP